MEENIKLKQVKLIKENNKLLLTKNINYISHLKKKKKKKIILNILKKFIKKILKN